MTNDEVGAGVSARRNSAIWSISSGSAAIERDAHAELLERCASQEAFVLLVSPETISLPIVMTAVGHRAPAMGRA